MKHEQNSVGQELSEFTPVESVGCELVEAGSLFELDNTIFQRLTLENRIAVLKTRKTDTNGVRRKLERKLRNLNKEK